MTVTISAQKSLKDIILELSTGKMTILCGSGVSFMSGLPTVESFYTVFLSKIFSYSDAKEIQKVLSNSSIPFEKVMETILDYMKDESLLEMFRNGEPNMNHAFIGQLLIQNVISNIYTTNFDCLLEKYLNDKGLRYNIDYSVLFKEGQFIKASGAPGEKQVIKLHGTADYIHSLRVVLSKIAAQNMSKNRGNAIRELFCHGGHEMILVMGYSFSDTFDINKYLEDAKEIPKNIFIIEHQEIEKEMRIEPLTSRNGDGLFNNPKFSGYRIWINTQEFIRIVWPLFVSKVDYEEEKQRIIQNITILNYSWRKDLVYWLGKFERNKLDYLGGVLLNNVFFDFKKAKKYHLRANKNSSVEQDPDFYFFAQLQLLLSKHRSAKSFKAVKLVMMQSKKLLLLLGDKKSVVTTDKKYNLLKSDLTFRIARLYDDYFNDPRAALLYYFRAYKADFHNKDKEGMAKTLHQIGTIYSFNGNLPMAKKCFIKSIRLKRKIGLIGGIARSYYELGNAYYIGSKYKSALNYYLKAEALLKTGELDLRGFILQQKALIFFHNSCFMEARDLFIQKENLPETLRNEFSLASVSYNLGKCEMELGNLSRAGELYERAREIHKRLNKVEYYVKDCQELSVISMLVGELDKAYEYLVETLPYIDDMKPVIQAYCYMYWAFYFDLRSDKIQSNSYLHESMLRFKEIESTRVYYKLARKFKLIK